MIPFARIAKYGNTVAAPTGIKDFQANSSHAMALAHDGTMWAFGSSTSGSMGTGFPVADADRGWYKSNISNVKSFSSNMQNSTIALTHDDRVLVCGAPRADKFGAPDIPTTNLDWLDITDHIPQEILDAGIAQIMNHSYYVAILTKNNFLYTSVFRIGNTSTVIAGTTWYKNTFGDDMNINRVVGLAQSPSGAICVVQDGDGYLYGIGYNGYRTFATSPVGQINTYTKMGEIPYVQYSLANGGTYSCGVLSTGRSVYSGAAPGPGGFNSTFSAFIKVGLASQTVFGFNTTTMAGAYNQNQLPIAASGNTASIFVTNLRSVPAGTQTKDIRFICGNDVKNVYVLYEDDLGVASLYCLGPNVGQGNNLNAPFIKVDLPPALLN